MIQDERDFRVTILDVKDIKEEEITIPEWGDIPACIKELTGAERAEVLNACLKKDGMPDLTKLYPLLVIKSLRYPKNHKRAGERIFQPADRDSIAQKSGAVVERIGLIAMKLSGMTDQSRDDTAKNLEESQNEEPI